MTQQNNKIDTKGKINISLQDIQAHDISIVSGNEVDPEIKTAKKDIAKQIAKLLQLLALLQEHDAKNEPKLEEQADFEEIDFEDLLKSIEFGNCVLFVGPEIAVDEDGKSLHESFFRRISNSKRTYNSEDGFFMPNSENRLINVSKDYYANVFPQDNIKGNLLLSKLAQIPFDLVICLTPDDTMRRIFDNYNIKHKFLYFTGTVNADEKFVADEKVVYNALGSAAANGRYIYTHKQFNEYIKKNVDAKFPFEIENKIKKEDTTHYLFVGFDFNKWYYKLLMYELNLLPDAESFTFDSNKTRPLNRDFIQQQFNLTFINSNYESFTDVLLHKSQEAGLTKTLNSQLTESLLNELESIRVETVDSSSLQELMSIKNKLNLINQKISRL